MSSRERDIANRWAAVVVFAAACVVAGAASNNPSQVGLPILVFFLLMMALVLWFAEAIPW